MCPKSLVLSIRITVHLGINAGEFVQMGEVHHVHLVVKPWEWVCKLQNLRLIDSLQIKTIIIQIF